MSQCKGSLIKSIPGPPIKSLGTSGGHSDHTKTEGVDPIGDDTGWAGTHSGVVMPAGYKDHAVHGRSSR